jgi:hypothetical protein
MEGLEEDTQRENERARVLNAEMERVVQEMRWVMGIKNVRDAEGSRMEER